MSCSVPVRASCPQPQNSATPKKHKPVATSEAKGAPMRHLAQHSSKPREKRSEVGRDRRDREHSEPAAQEQASMRGGRCPEGSRLKENPEMIHCGAGDPNPASSWAGLHPSVPRDRG